MSEIPRIVIVGAGMAGMCSAERLRELGFDGEIVIIGSEASMPTYRPALTKQFLTGEFDLKDVVAPPPTNLDAVWRLSTSVTQLDPQRRVVFLPGGEEIAYDGLVIATGVEARRLPHGIHGHPRVTVLRTIADSSRLRKSLTSTRDPVVMIGNGFIGCELASSIRHMGHNVVIIGRNQQLMGNLLDAHLGWRLTELHRRNQVRLQLGVQVSEWSAGPSRVELLLSNGMNLTAGAVVSAVGSVPSVSWLRDSGAQLEDGVLCEPSCHVTGLEDVVAAGDVARWPNLRFGAQPRRVEHWTNAIEMGRHAAESLLMGREAATPFMPVPRFWSEQHGVQIQAVGMLDAAAERRPMDPDSPGGHSVTTSLRDGSLTGAIGFDNSVAVMRYAKELQGSRPIKEAVIPPVPQRTSIGATQLQSTPADLLSPC